MYRYMMKKKLLCLTGVGMLVVSCTTGSLFALVMSALIDCVEKGKEELTATLCRSVLYVVINIMLQIIYRYMKAAVLAESRFTLKRDLFTCIMNQEITEFDTRNSAEYINELSNNMNLFESVYFNNITGMLECLVSFVSAAAICIIVEPVMLALMIFLAFLTMIVTRLTTEPLKRSTDRFADSAGEYMAEIQDDFGGFRLIHSAGILNGILKKHERINKGMEAAKRQNADCQILCACTGQFVGLLSTILVMAAAAWFALEGMFSAGMVIAFGHLIGNIVSPITRIPSIIANFSASRPLQERFKMLLAIKAEDGTEELTDLEEGIELDSLSFHYPDGKEVFRQLSFHFRAGGHYAVTGDSGSGKSTLLSLLEGDYSDYIGSIRLDGRELRNLKKDCLRELTGMVSQDTFLFNDTIQNNITLYQEGYTAAEIEKALEQAGLKALIDSLPEGTGTRISENGKNFSGGEKQRISLARVLLQKKKILLLDEFTAHLDEQTAGEIEGRLLAEKDCMVLTVTHHLQPKILGQYDQVLVLSQDGLYPREMRQAAASVRTDDSFL